jgi:hypothetical protein
MMMQSKIGCFYPYQYKPFLERSAMDDFIFDCQTKIIFGKKSLDLIGKECKKYGKKILLHYGSGSIMKSGWAL